MNACTGILVSLLVASMPVAAQATVEVGDPIPTVLVATDEPVGYPDPICSKCSILVLEEEASAGARAEVVIEYPLDAPTFTGEVEVTVRLVDDERRTVWIDAVNLEPGEDVALVAEAESDWSWDEVELVWLRFLTE